MADHDYQDDIVPAALPDDDAVGEPSAPRRSEAGGDAPVRFGSSGRPGGGGRREGGRREGGRERGGYGRRRVCGFCMENIQVIDYKDTTRLRRFLSERGKIEPRRKTGTCAKHQRWLTTALKQARQLALLPYTAEHVRFLGR